jgi:hypothetical protein
VTLKKGKSDPLGLNIFYSIYSNYAEQYLHNTFGIGQKADPLSSSSSSPMILHEGLPTVFL